VSLDSYNAIRTQFHWDIPEHYNIGVDVCDRWAQAAPKQTALIHEEDDGTVQRVSFADLQRLSNQAANGLQTCGIQVGDRVAILLAQSPQTAIMHIAAYKVGAIAVPLFSLFGPDALQYRLRDSGARLLLTDREGAQKIATLRAQLPDLKTVLVAAHDDTALPHDTHCLQTLMAAQSETFSAAHTRAEDPALLIYTSGTTGKPKGALHAHRVLLGHLPGVDMSHGGQIDAGDIFWTPADWAWIGGLLDVLMPALHHGATVVSRRFSKFDAAAALDLMCRHRVQRVFLPPTALKMLRAEGIRQPALMQSHPPLLSIASGGESLGAEILAWGRNVLGVDINEFYGQTECNMVLSSCHRWFAATPGAIGKAVPGHDVAIVDTHGKPLPPGHAGHIAVRTPDPVMFLGYWNQPQATQEKFAGAYLLTGDLGTMDADGFVRFVGRDDDVITSAGYRIGPGPIEDCLLGHPAVRMAAVVGVPDSERSEIVKAFVVLAEGVTPSEALTQDLQAHVRTRLAAHEYPRLVEYVVSLPMTSTGKVMRRVLRDGAVP